MCVWFVCVCVSSVALAFALRQLGQQGPCGVLRISVGGFAVVRVRAALQTVPVSHRSVIVLIICNAVLPELSGFPFAGGTLKAVDGFMWKHVVSLVMLLYLCWCTFLCIFRLKFFGLLELSGNRCVFSVLSELHNPCFESRSVCMCVDNHRQTDAYSLLFNAAFMCRLQFAISFNFIQLTTIGHSTAFEACVSHECRVAPQVTHACLLWLPSGLLART